MLLIVNFLFLATLLSFKDLMTASAFADIKAKSDAVISANLGTDLQYAQDHRTPLTEAKTNFLCGISALDLSNTTLHQNFFWCAAGEKNDFPADPPYTGSMSYTENPGAPNWNDNGQATLSSRTWGSWNRAKYNWKRESTMAVASYVYLILHYPSFYVGSMCGRIYFSRSLKNKHVLDPKIPGINISTTDPNIFQNERSQANRFWMSNSTVDTSSNQASKGILVDNSPNLACISAKNKNNCICSFNDGSCKIITQTSKTNTASFSSLVMSKANAKASMDTYFAKNPFLTQIIPNYKLRWSDAEGTNLLNDVAAKPEYGGNNDGYDGAWYIQLMGNRIRLIAKQPIVQGHQEAKYNVGTGTLISADSFLGTQKNVFIPVATSSIDQAFAITPYAGVIAFKNNDTLMIKPDTKELCHLRAACLDLAANKKSIAFLGVGVKYPALDVANNSLASFDPYSGENYYSYLRVMPNSNILAASNYLSAEVGAEGEDEAFIDQYVVCTDIDIKDKASFKSNFMKFIDFDKNGNLFILTDTGQILFYKAKTIENKINKGKITPQLLVIDGINSTTNSIDFISCGDGIVARKSNDATLYYLTDDDVRDALSDTPGISWRPCLNNLKAKNFAYTNDGTLFIYDGTQITAFDQPRFQVETVNTLIAVGAATMDADKNIIITDYVKYLAVLCHEALGTADQAGNYFGVTLSSEFGYEFVKNISMAQDWLTKFRKLYNGNPPNKPLASNFWQQIYAIVVRKAFDKLRITYQPTDTELGTEIGTAKKNFLISLNKFETETIVNNNAFKISTFQQKIQNLERLSVGQYKDELIKVVTALSADAAFSFGKTSFSDYDDVLTSEIDKDSSESNLEQNMAKATIIRSWLDKYKNMSLKIGVPQSLLDNWNAKLLSLEGTLYTEASSNEKKPESIVQNINIYLTLLGNLAQPNGGLITASSLIDSDKSDIAAAFIDIADNCKNYMSSDQLLIVKNAFTFLDNKFKLSSDSQFKNDLSQNISSSKKTGRSGLFSQMISNELEVIYGSAYLLAQFKKLTVALTADKIPALLDSLKIMIKDKAIFEPNKTGQGTVGNGNIADKNSFVTYLTNFLDADPALKEYQAAISEKTSDLSSFAYWITQFKTPAEIADYIFLLQEISGRIDAADNEKIAINILAIIKSPDFIHMLSPQNLTNINNSINSFAQRGVNSLGNALKANDLGIAKDFKTFLKNQKNNSLITTNIDAETHLFDGSKKIELLSFWTQLQRSTEYSPNFNDEFQKHRYLSLLSFTKISLETMIENSLESDPLQPNLQNALGGVKAQILKQVK